MPRYTNEELANMLLIYGECQKNERLAAVLYANRFPDKQHPCHALFGILYRRICENGTLHASTRPRNIRQRSEVIINQVRDAVLANPHASTRCIARELNINHITVHRIIKNNLGRDKNNQEQSENHFERHTMQELSPQDLLNRETFCDWISDQVDIDNIANDNFLRRILWTNECTFRSDGSINHHNEHYYVEENPNSRKETHLEVQYDVTVWMGIVDDVIIGPHFFPEGINITEQVYSEFLEKTLPNLLDDVPLNILPNIIYQQDDHPAHISSLVRAILNHRFPHRWIGIHSDLHEWPPRSPDLTPIDFFAWDYIQDQVYETLPRNRDDLIEKIQAASRNITPAILHEVRENFMRRVALCLEESGGYFEHSL